MRKDRRTRTGRAIALALVVAALLFAEVPVAAQAGPGAASPPRSSLQRDVDALIELGVTGALARLETPDGVQLARAGVADLDTRRPVPPDSYLRIGSTTKTFVAVVVLQLVAEGRLSLDDPVHRWLPGVVTGNGNDGRTITVRQLLNHTSGLYNYVFDLVPRYLTPEDYRRERWRHYRPDELVAMALRHPPGSTDWAYSNTNYVLAGMLVEAVTGRDWQREVHDRILRPLGLRRTLTPGSWPFLPAPHARNYHQFTPDGELIDTTVAIRALDSGADGSMISTATDLNQFFAALLAGRLLPPAQLAEMRRLVPVPADQGYPAGTGGGLGLFRTPLSCGGEYWGHGGNGFGYTVEPAVTGDGSRRLTVTIFSGSFAPAPAAAWNTALRGLVDRALC